jgi:hypothetical protein
MALALATRAPGQATLGCVPTTPGLFVLCLSLTLLVTYVVRRRRARRDTERDPLARAFASREMRELDAHMDAIARCERRRLEREVESYLTGAVGYVVTISRSPAGIALELSDGRRLALTGVSRRMLPLLLVHAAEDLLQPTHVERDALSCRLRLRGQAGTKIDIFARNVALATS